MRYLVLLVFSSRTTFDRMCGVETKNMECVNLLLIVWWTIILSCEKGNCTSSQTILCSSPIWTCSTRLWCIHFCVKLGCKKRHFMIQVPLFIQNIWFDHSLHSTYMENIVITWLDPHETAVPLIAVLLTTQPYVILRGGGFSTSTYWIHSCSHLLSFIYIHNTIT